ncbi:MAG: hypothetical protein RJB38_303 [Pseudomonadota bacterium]|jgi:hypothetical protein
MSVFKQGFSASLVIFGLTLPLAVGAAEKRARALSRETSAEATETPDDETSKVSTSHEELPQDPHDLSYSEARRLFVDFGVDVDEETSTVRVKGFFYKACAEHFSIAVKRAPKKGRADFMIQDHGALSSCIQEQRKKYPGARPGSKVFGRLSDLTEAKIQAEGQDLEVGFGWEDTSVDPPKVKVLSFDPPIRFTSKLSRERQEKQEAEGALNEQLEQCENVAKSSRGTEQKELEALSAINILLRQGQVDEAEADTLRQSIASDQLKRLRAQALKATAEDIASIDDQLSAWISKNASADQKLVDSLTQLRMDTAERVSIQNLESVEASETALNILHDIVEASDASPAKKALAEGRILPMKGNVVAGQIAGSAIALVSEGNLAAQEFQVRHALSMQAEFQEHIQSLGIERNQACQLVSQSRGRNREALTRCQKAQTALASEPERILGAATSLVMKTLSEMAPRQPAAPAATPPAGAPGQTPMQQPGVNHGGVPGGNQLPYPYRRR